jgi:NADPH:quinone reductase-like Zn-dependent oxidoreductase/acyl carrier protein
MYSKKETLAFDATVMDRQGRPLVEIEGMTLRRIDQGRADLAARTRMSAAPASEPAAASERANFRLVMDAPGMFSGLEMRPAPRQAPDRGQVEIEVACAGLNFKDVLRALGMIPGMKGGDVSDGFGSECAGRVTRVGEGVSGLAPGDDVLAIAPSAFGAFAVTFADLVVPMPAGLGFAPAAAMPLVFLTAYHALVNQARLVKGERVLIHAAAGGVGLAAIQIARHLGAEIFATAGSAAKHEYLKSLGVEHVTSSRSLSFADDIRAWTGGSGVDVVLNSLAGEFIPASLALLRPYGRFVEIGARDIYENAPLGLRPFGNNLSFSAIDMGPMFLERPDMVRTMLLAILQHMQRGEYQPLPVQTFAVADAERALEFMAAARHIGKIAIEMQPMVRGIRRDGLDAGAAAAPLDFAAAPSDLGDRISRREGVEALTRVLGARHPQVVVSPRDLVRFLEWQSETIKSLRDSPQAVAAAPSRIEMARPDLATPFMAPRSQAETTIAAVWRDLLGLQEIGIHDSFFELGGDSLIGVQVLSRIRKAFNVQLPSSVLYEGPTVASLAALVTGTVVEPTEAFAQQRGRAEKRRERQQRRLVPE